MKVFSRIMMAAALALAATSCLKYNFELDYEAPIKISFEGVGEDNIATLERNVTDYQATINVKSEYGLVEVQVYAADNKTGVAGDQLDGYVFSTNPKDTTIKFDFSGLTDHAAIRITASDMKGTSVSKNLVVMLTPNVIINDALRIETADVYFGTYYAGWLGGRAYLRSFDNIEAYKGEIDFSLAEVEGKPMAISPADRDVVYNLPNLSGLHSAKVGETSMTPAQFAAINVVDASPITSIPDPTEAKVEVQNNKVYVFLRNDGVKGLFLVTGLAAKTATIENINGVWEEGTAYHQMNVEAKIIAE